MCQWRHTRSQRAVSVAPKHEKISAVTSSAKHKIEMVIVVVVVGVVVGAVAGNALAGNAGAVSVALLLLAAAPVAGLRPSWFIILFIVLIFSSLGGILRDAVCGRVLIALLIAAMRWTDDGSLSVGWVRLKEEKRGDTLFSYTINRGLEC